MKRLENALTANIGLGNRLADGITISCSSLSAKVPADEQISVFYIYLQLKFEVFQSADSSGETFIEYQPIALNGR